MTSSSRDGVVTFQFYRPAVSEVKVLGSLNGWSGDSLAMTPQRGGWWTLDVKLPPGEYRFRYWADGEWFTDFAANGVENTKYGWNSVLIVSERTNAMSIDLDDNNEGGSLRMRVLSENQVSVAA